MVARAAATGMTVTRDACSGGSQCPLRKQALFCRPLRSPAPPPFLFPSAVAAAGGSPVLPLASVLSALRCVPSSPEGAGVQRAQPGVCGDAACTQTEPPGARDHVAAAGDDSETTGGDGATGRGRHWWAGTVNAESVEPRLRECVLRA